MALLLASLLLLASAALLGQLAVRRDIGHAVRGYQQLRQLYEVGAHLAAARTMLTLDRPESIRADQEMAAARLVISNTDNQRVDQFRAIEEGSSPEEQAPTSRLAAKIDGMQMLHHAIGVAMGAPHGLKIQELDNALGQIAGLAADIRASITDSEQAADARHRQTLVALACIAIITFIAASIVAVKHYRLIMRPVRQMGQVVRRMAGGNLRQRVEPVGPQEFALLAGDFNRMADQLQTLYSELEQQVAIKSAQLVRSEKLAGVGYLAAGVAHEINNPLGIIAGYAEMQLQQLRQTVDGRPSGESSAGEGATEGTSASDPTAANGAVDKDAASKAAGNRTADNGDQRTDISATIDVTREDPTTGLGSGDGGMGEEKLDQPAKDGPTRQSLIQNLTIIAEEAFRCQEIIDRLLMLSRSDERPAVVRLGDVAAEVVQAAHGLQQGRDHALELDCADTEDTLVLASESKLKQVVLNLIVNALQACEQPGGKVKLTVSRHGPRVRLTISDNGKGMTPGTIEQIFSPFYTESRGAGSRGIGLGLSITHAIVEQAGGSIHASSEGLGKGSTFVVDLPHAATTGHAPDSE